MVIIIVLIVIIFIVLATYGSIYFPYKMLQPYLKTKDGRKLVFKYGAFWMLGGLVMYVLAYFVMNNDPPFFKQGMEQLNDNPSVKSRIGGFSSYTWQPDKFPVKPTSIAVFQVSLNGESDTLYLTCTMKKHGENWELVKTYLDSVRKVR